MLQEAAWEHGLNLLKSTMVGNRLSDIQAGIRAGCSAVLLDLHVPREEKSEAVKIASLVAADWNSAVQWIQGRNKA